MGLDPEFVSVRMDHDAPLFLGSEWTATPRMERSELDGGRSWRASVEAENVHSVEEEVLFSDPPVLCLYSLSGAQLYIRGDQIYLDSKNTSSPTTSQRAEHVDIDGSS